MKDLSYLCVEDLKAHLTSLSSFQGKTFEVYSEAELMDRSKGLMFPAAGVVYEGMRAIPESDKESHKVGISCELVAAIMVIQKPEIKDAKKRPLSLLDSIREEILGKRSPTGHFWKFVVEAAAVEKSGAVIWLQRWSTPVQLVPVVR